MDHLSSIYGLGYATGALTTLNVFQCLSSIASVLGIIIGVFYFFKRISWEKNRDESARRAARVAKLRDLLQVYDDLILKIYTLNVSSDQELLLLRVKLRQTFSLIETYLEHLLKYRIPASFEHNTFLLVFSISEKSPIIHSLSLEEIRNSTKETIEPEKNQYTEAMRQSHLLSLLLEDSFF